MQGGGGSSAFYNVSVPVDRVRPNLEQFLDEPEPDYYGGATPMEGGSNGLEGVELTELRWEAAAWDESDMESDPSSRFPLGA